MDLTNLEKSILRVVCFFDNFDHPLTLIKIYKWLDEKYDITNVSRALRLDQLGRYVDSSQGFYFLRGRQEIISSYLRNYSLADQKYKKALRVINILKYFPWIKAVAVYSSLSYSNANRESDIDLFIVSSPRRLWSGRFFISLFLKFFGLRPTSQRQRDKICISFLADEDSLDLSFLVGHSHDLNYIYGTSQFVFLYDAGGVATKFFSQNSWIGDQLPNWFAYSVNLRRRASSGLFFVKNLSESVLGIFPEQLFRRFQLRILSPKLQSINKIADNRVIISSGLIKLHEHNKSLKFQQIYQEKLSQLLKSSQSQ
ncbi:MAG TPA: hypothetical protein VJB67_00460 [Patescibacteria group bacterium]|nr:hypothetical protein [Patescibacteria group bacterium]